MLYFFDILSLKLLDKIIFLDCVKDKKIKFLLIILKCRNAPYFYFKWCVG